MWWVSKTVSLLFLGVLSYLDIRTRRIPLNLLLAGGAAGVVYHMCAGWQDWVSFASAAAAGAGFLLVSKITREGIGYGDSGVILVLGIWTGIRELTGALTAGFFLLLIFSVTALCTKKLSGKYEVPFVPFLAAGYLLVLIAGGGKI